MGNGRGNEELAQRKNVVVRKENASNRQRYQVVAAKWGGKQLGEGRGEQQAQKRKSVAKTEKGKQQKTSNCIWNGQNIGARICLTFRTR